MKYLKQKVWTKKEYVKTEKLCFNCFSKEHSLKDWNSKYRCRVNNCNKKHNSLIHYETASSNSLSIKEPLTNNNSDNCNKINQTAKEKGVMHLQVLPINVSNREKTFRLNTLLDGGSDSILISKTLADKLELPGNDLSLTVTNVLLIKSEISSKLIDFSISSSHHPSPISKSNVCVVKNLNLPAYRMKNDFDHLKNIKLEQLLDKNISILIGADEPRLYLYTESRIRNTNEPVA